MKILVILSRLPYPLEKGDKLRAYNQLRELNERHEIILCCLTEQKVTTTQTNKVSAICSELHIFELSRIRVYFNLLLAIFSRKPFQVHYFYQRSIHRRIEELINRSEPDHIYCQLIRTAEYAKDEHNFQKTLDYQDAFSKGMERRSERSRFPLREIFQLERKRLVAYENICFEYFENKTIISEEDRKHIYHPERQAIQVISNGIDTRFFCRQENLALEYDLVFVGNMGYPPNIETAEYIVHQVLPLLRESFGQIKVLIAGSSPTKRVLALKREKGVDIKAGVDDIRTAYGAGKVFFAPMQIGTGLQNKLLEAMAMEIPCVTSDLANKALEGTNGENILVSINPKGYAEHIEKLLKNPELCTRIGKAGRKYVEERFSWKQSTELLEQMMIAQKSDGLVNEEK